MKDKQYSNIEGLRRWKVLINVPWNQHIGDIEALDIIQARAKAEIKFADKLDDFDEISLFEYPD